MTPLTRLIEERTVDSRGLPSIGPCQRLTTQMVKENPGTSFVFED
ncbi:MAG: hypothetical protein QW338_01155 [Conexivisphaerales archaeon]